MALVSKSIPNLINGISQQPPSLRLGTQGEVQENGLSDIVDGLKKRPHTKFLRKLNTGDPTSNTYLTATELSTAHIHTYKRSAAEQFTVILVPATPKLYVYDIEGRLRYESGVASWKANGDSINTNAQNDAAVLSAYFGTSLNSQQVTATSVADYTFYVNKEKVVARDETSPDNVRPYEGMFYLKRSDYGKVYRAKLLNTSGVQLETGFWETKDGDDPDQVDTLRTGNIMTTICGLTNDSSYAASAVRMSVPAGFTRYSDNGLPFFTFSNSTTDFIIEATDEDGGNSLFTHKDTVATFTTLPKYCQENFTIAVIGDNQKREDNFYVRYDGTNTAGSWKECPAPSRPNASQYHSFTASTMPHTLIQNGDESFSFTTGTWDERKAGDDDTNPFPSFVGGKINDVFFHRNRLGFLSDENVIFSEANGYFNFFRTTVRSLLDSAPIDVAVSQNEVSILKAAIPFQEQLLLFSELNQFTLSADQLLTPAEVSIDTSTSFECDLTANPVGAGNSVFFGTKAGSFAGVREYYTDNSTEIKDATLVTQHVPYYLKGNIRRMVASTNEDMLICLTSSVKSEAYIYKYYDSSSERLQSSWSKWVFDTDIVDMSFNNSDLYITFSDGRFEKMDLSQQAPEISFVVTNDIKADLTPTAAINTTYTSSGDTYILKGFVSQERAVDYSGFSPDISSGFGTINNAAITSCFLYKATNTSVTPNTSIYALFGTIDRTKLGINKIEDYPTSVTLEGTTLTLDATYNQSSLDSLSNSQLLNISATITETQFNALLNNTSAPTDITLNRVSTTFTKKDYPVHLDHQVKLQASTSAAASFTTSDLNTAYTATSVTQFIDHKGDLIATGNSDVAKAKVVAVIHNKEHTENGSTVGSYVYVGEPFTFKYQLSEQVFKPAQGDTTDIARFQLRNINFKYNDTGTFDVTTVSTGRTPKVTNFTGRITGQANNLLGYAAVVDDGSFKVGVQSQAKETAITITNSSHLPSTFQSAEWEGLVHLRNQRI